MAEAGRITKGWIGLNLTDEEAEALTSWWGVLTDNVDSHDLNPHHKKEFLLAERVIHTLERAT